jgi:hypothetical protein
MPRKEEEVYQAMKLIKKVVKKPKKVKDGDNHVSGV